MAYTISQTDPATLKTEELLEEISSFKTLAAEVAERYAALLKELKKRRKHHPFMRHPALSFFEEIAAQELDAEAAINLSNREMIKAILPLPRGDQKSISHGTPIQVATRNAAGAIVLDEMPITRMDKAHLKRAFGPDGIRPANEQEELLRAEARITRHGAISVLKDEVALKIGNQKIKPEELAAPLLALGYRLIVSGRTEDAA